MPEVATPNQGEREFETGTDEFFKAHSELTAANAKRTYDAYQDLDLVLARRSQLQFDQLQNVALQAPQNSVETSNMVAKQAVRHADVAADALWTDELNPVTRGAGSNLTAGAVPSNRATDVSAAGVGVDAQAVAAAVAKQVDAKLVKGYRKLEWQKMRERNEALDCRVYARAAAARVGREREHRHRRGGRVLRRGRHQRRR